MEVLGSRPRQRHDDSGSRRHPNDPYIVINDLPKVRNFEHTLPELYRARAVPTTLAR
jgi:hypothetical protein